MKNGADLSRVSEEELIQELQNRGSILCSQWRAEHVLEIIENDDECSELTKEEKQNLATSYLELMAPGLGEQLRERGFDFLEYMWDGKRDELMSAMTRSTSPR